jgi:hypothetical protein
MTRAFVSIDWDFFIREEPNWDWGHQESPLFFGPVMWTIRAGGLIASGIDPREELDPDKHAKPRPEEFFCALRQLGFDFTTVEAFWVAESHLGAYVMFSRIYDNFGEPPVPDVLFNFDAHHDLGYKGFESLSCAVREGRIACDDWLAHLLLEYEDLEVRVILPDWERDTLKDQRKSMKRSLPTGASTRVAIDTFSQRGKPTRLLKVDDDEIEVTGVFIARSGSWAPPWLDKRLKTFVKRAEQTTLLPAFVFSPEGWPNPLQARPFDMQQAYDYAEQLQALHEQATRK